MIVMPGFVDSHRHIWEGLLRNIGTDVPLEGRTSYISFVLHKLAPAFRPEDAYVGNLVSALGAIDAGITTLLDWSHIQDSPAHTDAVIQALNDSGLRAVFAYGFPWWGKWEERQPSWFVRAATEHFSSKDQKLTLALAAPGPEFTDFEVTRDHWKLARDRRAHRPRRRRELRAGREGPGVRGGGAPGSRHHLHPLHHAERHRDPDDRRHRWHGLAGVAGRDDDGSRDAPHPEVPRPGLRPSLSVDVETNVPADMFNQMRSVLGLQRAIASAQGKAAVSPREVLAYATVEGTRPTGWTRRSGR